MKKQSFLFYLLFLSVLHAQMVSWPSFRGDGNSITEAKNLPSKWSDDKNIAWKFALSGYGQSSPVIWEDKVFVTSSNGDMKEDLIVYCIDLHSGHSVWSRHNNSSFHIKRDKMASQSAPTPVVDSNGIYTFFENGDIVALNHKGDKLWSRNLVKEYGVFKGNHGIGSSLAQTKDAIILLIEHEGPSYLLNIDKTTGKTNWKLDRTPRVSWSSPVVSNDNIIISSNGIVEVYNAISGKQIWYVDGIEKNTVSSPSCTEDVIVIGSSAKRWCMAIKRNGSGNAKENILWKADVSCSFSSPLIYKNNVYFVNRAGVLTCVDLKDGSDIWSTRLSASTWASPILSENHVYFFCKDGTTVVIDAESAKYTEIASNSINIEKDSVYGTAATDNNIVLRTGNQVICVRNDNKQ